MPKPDQNHIHPTDVRGLSQLVIDATLGITNLVEALHSTILRVPAPLGRIEDRPTVGITGLVYTSIRMITGLVGGSIDLALAPLVHGLRPPESSTERDAALAILNGVVGDYLQQQGNPLALPMSLWMDGGCIDPHGTNIRPDVSTKILVIIHGLCLNEQHWGIPDDYGQHLTDLGYTPVYVRYNTGLHISTNGRTFADVLAALSSAWPQPISEITILAHSMGGLVTRSACQIAEETQHGWRQQLRSIIFLGTPHHGSPWERVGNWVHTLLLSSPYSAAFARLGQIRSAGITDLRYGTLRDAEWADTDRFAPLGDPRLPLALPTNVDCYLVASSTSDVEAEWWGDGLVPVASALGRHSDPRYDLESQAAGVWIGEQINHMGLLNHPAIDAQIRAWLTHPKPTPSA
ncbi:lipase family alpha/beta hydrolase [Candidatus Oscillochloris fontis]|uniref:lipase family alpha/beta hydrolase n=1 Tax=Candidatus Oscillochloris fontis TaxID=2496868 RepID=UPI00101B7841|nr:alpha/beta hydrolase [Candidatus Oscillochloris fontis]